MTILEATVDKCLRISTLFEVTPKSVFFLNFEVTPKKSLRLQDQSGLTALLNTRRMIKTQLRVLGTLMYKSELHQNCL